MLYVKQMLNKIKNTIEALFSTTSIVTNIFLCRINASDCSFSKLSGKEKGRSSLAGPGTGASSLIPCLSFPAGLAFRNSPKGRGPQDCLPVFAGKPSGYAEFLAVTRSWKRSNLPGWKGKELECCLGYGSCPPDKHTAQPPSPGEVCLSSLLSFCLKKKCLMKNFNKKLERWM